jgi:hypothetical protein
MAMAEDPDPFTCQGEEDCEDFWRIKSRPDPFNPNRIQEITIVAVSSTGGTLEIVAEVSSTRAFVEVPLAGSTVEDGTVTVIAGIMTPEFVTHLAFDGKMVESAWLVPFTCEELDLIVNAVYARRGFAFPQKEKQEFFRHFDLKYQPDSEKSVTQIEATFSSQDQLTLLRVGNALEEHSCSRTSDEPPEEEGEGE